MHILHCLRPDMLEYVQPAQVHLSPPSAEGAETGRAAELDADPGTELALFVKQTLQLLKFGELMNEQAWHAHSSSLLMAHSVVPKTRLQ